MIIWQAFGSSVLRRIKNPLTWVLFLSFTLSLVTLIIYLTGVNFQDEFLFFLLSVSKYSAVVMLVCSIYSIIRNINKFFHHPSFYYIFKFLGYIIIIFYCIGIFYFEAFITVITGGYE